MKPTPSTDNKPTRSTWIRLKQWFARDRERQAWGDRFIEEYRKGRDVEDGKLITYDNPDAVCRMTLRWDERLGEYKVSLPELNGETNWVRESDYNDLLARHEAEKRENERLRAQITHQNGRVEVGDGL